MADAGSSQPPASAQSAPSNTTTAPSSQQPQQPSIKPDPTDADIDATIDEDITMNGDGTKVAAGPTEPKDTEMGNMGLPGADVNENPVAAAAAGATAPSKKDVNLREFLSKIDDYAPIVSGLIPLLQRCAQLTRSDLRLDQSYHPKYRWTNCLHRFPTQ